jgi:hypothetical protein
MRHAWRDVIPKGYSQEDESTAVRMYPHDHLPHVSALADAMDAISGGNAKKRQPKKCNCGEEGDSCDRMRRRGMAALYIRSRPWDFYFAINN